MYVFGGWVPLMMEEAAAQDEKEWKCTNTLAALNMSTFTWENIAIEMYEGMYPVQSASLCS